MDDPIFVDDCWWYYFHMHYGIYRIEFYFTLMLDRYGSQMLCKTYYCFVIDMPPPSYHSMHKYMHDMPIKEDKNPLAFSLLLST